MMRIIPFVALLLGLVACSESVSKPNYQFRPAPKAGIVANVAGSEITEAELSDGVEAEIYEAETKLFDVKFNRLRAVVLQRLMDKDPRKKDLSNDEFLEKYIAQGVKVSEGDVDSFVKTQKIPAEHVTPQVREKIKGYLEMEKKKEAVENWIASQTKNQPIEVYLSKPRRPTFPVEAGNSPSFGDKDAKVTIIEYSDFQCPFCAKGAEILQEIKKKYGNKVRVVFRNFPLPFHNQAEGAAVAGLCANEQGSDKFWKMHDAMFADQDNLSKEGLTAMAKKIGLKVAEFDACLQANKYLDQVKADMESGRQVKVKSTPTFFVNGQLINGAQPMEVFAELIDSELAAK